MQLQFGRHQRLEDDPVRKLFNFLFHQMGRRIAEGVEAVPAAQFNLAQLGMVVRIPVDVALTLVRLVGPFEQL